MPRPVDTRIVYSRWDGTRSEYSLGADRALDELSRYMMEGLSAQEALDWMREGGFELAGMDFRVMGTEELIAELQQELAALLESYNMNRTFDERLERLRDILAREERSVRREQGVESSHWNDFKRREDQLPSRLSRALERFRDYRWTDAEAESDYHELLESLDETRALEQFAAANRQRMQGSTDLSYEDAVDLMESAELIQQMLRDLRDGNFEALDTEALSQLLGDQAGRSIVMLRDLTRSMEEAGYLREGELGMELTPRALRRLGELALEDIYRDLDRGAFGGHETQKTGNGVVSTERSLPYEFGRPAHLDAIATVRNALQRSAGRRAIGGRSLSIDPGDIEVFDSDQLTETTTVLLLDMSWSMSWQGRWPAAKRVAVAMDHLIRTRFPRDRFFVVGFYTTARQLQVRELPELVWNMSEPFTNLQDGLRLAQRLIERHPNPNKQIIVITDGQPTAYFREGELHVEWPHMRGGISPNATRATLTEVRRVTQKSIRINTFMLDSSPELLQFVEAMTRINRGRAFYTTPDRIGQYVMVDYLDRKRKRVA